MLSTTIRICSAKSRGRVRNQCSRHDFLGVSSPTTLRILTTQYLARGGEIRFHKSVPWEFTWARCEQDSKAVDWLPEKRNEKGQAPLFASQEVVNNCNRNETIILHNHFVVRQQLVYGRFVAFQPCRCCVENKSSITRRPEGGASMRLIHVVVVAISIGRTYLLCIKLQIVLNGTSATTTTNISTSRTKISDTPPCSQFFCSFSYNTLLLDSFVRVPAVSIVHTSTRGA